jgi:hypothetical protein
MVVLEVSLEREMHATAGQMSITNSVAVMVVVMVSLQ